MATARPRKTAQPGRQRKTPKMLAAHGLVDAAMLESLGLDDLVPDALTEWRPLVRDGLLFFLDRLPVDQMMAIMADQMLLPEEAGASQRLVALLAHCPTLHKFGQVVARYPALHPELRRQLQTLESMPAVTPLPEVLARIRAELPAAAPVELGREALAEGSVAVVVPFTWRDPDNPEGIGQGVFKVLKPGIEEKLDHELAILVEVAPYLEARSRELGLPPIDYRDTLTTVRNLMLKEAHLGIEQHNLAAAAAFYANEPRLLVPRLLPWCTPNMTAMERVFGHKVTDARLPQDIRATLADTMISALLGQPFWSNSENAVVHADLHAGNLFVTDDHRLAVLDWSLTASLTKEQREALVAIALGGMMLDAATIRHAVASLGSLTHDDPILTDAVERALDRIVIDGDVPGFDWLLQLLDDLAFQTVTGFWEDFVLLRKSWLSLSGVIEDLVEDISPNKQLFTLALQRLLAEMPDRALSQPHTAGFATHVSNIDLLRLCASPWLVSLRYWERCWRQGMTFFGAGRDPLSVMTQRTTAG